MWEGTPSDVLAIAREVERLSGSAATVRLDTGRAVATYDSAAQFAEIVDAELGVLRSFASLGLIAPMAGGSIEVRFGKRAPNMRTHENGLSVLVRSTDSSASVTQVRDALVVLLDPGSPLLGPRVILGDEPDELATAKKSADGRRVSRLVVLWTVLSAGSFVAMSWAHRAVNSTTLRDVLFYCFCNPWIAVPIAVVIALVTFWVLSEFVMPAIAVYKGRPLWRKALSIVMTGVLVPGASAALLTAFGLKK
jgi:hypothetical protein